MENDNLNGNSVDPKNPITGMSETGNAGDESGTSALDRSDKDGVEISETRNLEPKAIDYAALVIFRKALEEIEEQETEDGKEVGEGKKTKVKSIEKYEDPTLLNGQMQYPNATSTSYAVTKVELQGNGQEHETLDIYKSFYDRESGNFKPVKIAIINENGEITLTEEYKTILQKQYREYALMMQEITMSEIKLSLVDPERSIELIESGKLTLELESLDPQSLQEKYQLLMLEGEQSKDPLALDGEVPEFEMPMPETDELALMAMEQGLPEEAVQSATEINPREQIATGVNFESSIGAVGRYEKVYVFVSNGAYIFIGKNKNPEQGKNGEFEIIPELKKSAVSQGERDVPIMDEAGKSIEKKQTRAIFNVANNNENAFALNVDPTGKVNVFYCIRGDDANEYFGFPVGTNRQVRTTGAAQRFMGVEVANRQNRFDAVNEAYEQLEEVEETNRTLIDQNEENDIIYYNIDEPIIMHDGSETTIANEARNSEKFKDDIQGYLKELEQIDGKCLSDKITSMREKILEEKEQDDNSDRDIGEELEAARLEALRREEQYRAAAEANNQTNSI